MRRYRRGRLGGHTTIEPCKLEKSDISSHFGVIASPPLSALSRHRAPSEGHRRASPTHPHYEHKGGLMKIVISSAGRRAHYVGWFREALGRTALSGEVIAMEYRMHSPSTGLADRALPSPAYNSPEYPEALRAWCRAERPDLFLSLNDYELQILSGGLAEEMRSMGCRVAVLGAELQPIVLDKHRMATALAERGIPTPRTVLGSEVDRIRSSARSGDRFVVKHRFGSGSTGLRIVEAEALPDAVEQSAQTALGADGLPAADGPAATVVQ